MLLYRVFRYNAAAKPGESGHPEYLHRPQGHGRWDNPASYDSWYLSSQPQGAVGEVYGDLATWQDTTFTTALSDGTRRALGTYRADDNLPILELDDPQALFERAIRPTQIVARNRPTTQNIALRIHRETNPDGSRKWAGLQWWSIRWPGWKPVCLWTPPTQPPPITLVDVELLHVGHHAVADAAAALAKPVT